MSPVTFSVFAPDMKLEGRERAVTGCAFVGYVQFFSAKCTYIDLHFTTAGAPKRL